MPDSQDAAAPPGLDYSSLKAAAEKQRAGSAVQPTPPDKVGEEFERALAASDIVSFDLFDTLVVRDVHHPTEVFLHLTGAAGLLRDPQSQGKIVERRREAENIARTALFQRTQSGEVVLTEIYEAFCKLVGRPAQEAAALAAAEEQVELRLCRANPPVRELFHRAVAAGKKIVVVSDTYHRQEFLVQLLHANDFPVPAELVFASSRHCVSKQTGELFTRVFPGLGVPPSRILHIGDHPTSDFQVPRQMGMKAILHPFRAAADRPENNASLPCTPLRSFVRSRCAFVSRCGEQRDDFWWTLGHNAFGPLMTGFCQWLDRSFRGDRLDRVYFLLRDGEIFHRVYSTLFPPGSNTPEVRTLPSSRRAFILPHLDTAPQFVLPSLTVGIAPRPAREFLARLGIPTDSLADEFRQAGFSSADEIIIGRHDSTRLARLFGRPRVAAFLRQLASQEMPKLIGFLRREGILDGGRIGVVDLGWTGSIHKALHLSLVHERMQPDLVGYYLCTLRGFRDYMPGPMHMNSFLLQLGEPPAMGNILHAAHQVLESICSSSQGSLIGFGDASEGFAPRLQPNNVGCEQLTQLASIHEGIVAFTQQYMDRRQALNLPDIPVELAVDPLVRVLNTPTKQEAQMIGGLRHSEDYGSTNRCQAARFRPESQTPQMLWEDYELTYWRPGLLNLEGPQAAALRTMLWLAQD